jgi:hypothetical protein
MAVLALLTQTLVLNSVDLSDHSKGCTVTAEAEQLDTTAMGDAWREYIGGLKAGTVTMELEDDYASSSVDATTWGAFNTGTPVAVATKPTSGAISTTNPEYQFNVLPTQWNTGGSVGELAMKSLTYPITGAITRDTTP